MISPPKSKAGTRTMFMPEAIADMLTAHLDRAGFDTAEADALVFTDD